MAKRILGIAAVVALVSGSWARAQDLTLGDKAPKLEVKEFVKGEPVKEFENGKVYVVEFWATWCGPCRKSIPHVTELQKKFKDVTFIGVSVWEDDQSEVKPFVTEMGDKMDYRVAMDAVSEGGKADEAPMAKNWMAAAGERGIPSAFVINKDGKVAWIGHPMSMDKPLEKIVDGSYNLEGAIAERKAAKVRAEKLPKIASRLRELVQNGDHAALLAFIDDELKNDPELEEMLSQFKLQALAKTDLDKCFAYAKKLADGPMGEDPMGLNNLAWMLIDPDNAKKPSPEMIKFALEKATKADGKAESNDPAISDTFARALFLSGDAKKALEVQERAVKLAKGTQFEQDPGMKQRLEEYKKAAEKAEK